MAFLEVHDLNVRYGAIHAIRGISFSVEAREIVTLIGANGAGKSTTMNAIMGGVQVASGRIMLDGEDITGLPPHVIMRKGIAISPEGRQVFARFTVRENLQMGAYSVRDKREVAQGFEQVYTLFPRLKEREKQLAGNLSGGEQQMLAVGRALMSAPRLLVLDEPSLGLAPILVQEIFDMIVRINEQGTTILLVEQNARLALSVSAQGHVLETGRIVLSDTGHNLAHNDEVRKTYLGGR